MTTYAANTSVSVEKLNEQGKTRAAAIANAFDTCLEALLAICPPGRELAITRTKLEEASFFAKKAMASDPANAEPMP